MYISICVCVFLAETCVSNISLSVMQQWQKPAELMYLVRNVASARRAL